MSKHVDTSIIKSTRGARMQKADEQPYLDSLLINQQSDRMTAYVAIHHSPTDQLIEWIRRGLPAVGFTLVAMDIGMDQETLIKYLGFGRSTLKRKIAANERLSQSESERVLGVTQLIVEVHRMVDESGETEAFDAAAWIGRWLRTPVPALKNRSPGEFLDTAIGQRHVFQIIRQMQSGAYV